MKKNLTLLIILFTGNLFGQNDRVNDYNSIAWLQSINTITLDKKWSLHLEYQWRREEGLKHWQQSLLRIGANYKLHDQVILHAGYSWIETFPYGDYPIASAGTFPEHRLYEQISFRQPVNKWTFLHRFRIEQRWLGKVEPGTDRKIEDWNFVHRFRYQFRSQLALWLKGEKQFFAAMADEIFIGAGKNVGANIFDQNRFFLLTGYKFNKRFTLEGGYLNQTLQQGRRVNDKIIMQRNNGWVLTSLLNL
jgi:hypothetical protein